MSKLKIIIADSQALTSEGVKSIIESIYCYELTSMVTSKNELFEAIKQLEPSIIIIDPDQLKDFAITDFEKLSDIFPVSNILVLTSNINKEYTLSVLAQGITHFILKTCSKDDFLNSLIGITQNEDYLCKHAIEMLLNKNSSVTLKKDKDVHLTKKEIEIIRAVAQGMTTKEIASKSFLSVHTVNTHRRNILKKLGFSNTSELVLYAVRNGITETLEYYI